MKNSILFSLEDDLSIKCKLFIRRVLVKAQYGSPKLTFLKLSVTLSFVTALTVAAPSASSLL